MIWLQMGCSDACTILQNVILSVAAGRKPRLLHSLAATEGSEAAAAPQLAVGRVIHGHRALRPPGSERRLKILRPPPGAGASLDRRGGGAQDDVLPTQVQVGLTLRPCNEICDDPKK